MTTKSRLADVARDELSVGCIYKDEAVASTYCEERFRFSWQRLMHEIQLSSINETIFRHRPEKVLEIAPGPARLTVDVRGVKRGFLVEYSQEMLKIAKKRLQDRGLTHVWTPIHGNAFQLPEIKELPERIDFVYTFRFIRHFHTEDRLRLYKAIHTKLPPGGLLMLDVVNKTVRERLDSKAAPSSKGSLPVYDVTYTIPEFREEMVNNGFRVVIMVPVIKYFALQSRLSYKLDDLAPGIVQRIVHLIEKLPSRQPLEWIALCQAV